MKLIQPQKKLGLSQTLALNVLVFACNLTGTAYALPGQPIKNVLQWAQNHPILPKLTSDQLVQYNYSGETNFEAGKLYFRVSYIQPTKVVNEERIVYNHSNQQLKFTKTNPRALRLIQRIYNQTVADDFRNSQYVTHVGTIQFYRGRKFAYVTDTEYPQTLSLIRLKDLAEEIRQARYCQTHHCDI